LQRFESLLLTPATILGTPTEAGLNQKNSTLSQNAQWRSQKPFKPCAEYCNLFVGHNTRTDCRTAFGKNCRKVGLDMEKKEIIEGMYNGILSLDKSEALKMAEVVIDEDLDINEIVNQSMSPAMDEVGKRFQSGEMFLPELQKAADVFSAAMDIIRPKLLETKSDVQPKGNVIIGTVKGDLHSIGKDLVATMLNVAGFKVTNLGVDIATFTFLEEAEKVNADVIALSALLTTTMPAQMEVIEALNSQGVRDKYKVIVGGAPVDQEWAAKIGADAYGKDAAKAVELVEKLCL
jgi:corrinoid protein of di/trimethylamine methyltransferase